MSEAIRRVVFDCNIFAQALITPAGNAGRCVEQVLDGKLSLFWSAYVLGEIRRIPEKRTPKRLGVTPKQAESLIAKLTPLAHRVDQPQSVYQHPIDPKDSHYIDLAVASGSTVIVSRDNHLLNLMNPARPGAGEFKSKYPRLVILQPERLLELVREDGTRTP